MFGYKCSGCGQILHGSAPEDVPHQTTCPECGGSLAPATADRKVFVNIGGAICEIRESDLKELTRKNYQRSGFAHALRVYRELFPDIGYQEARETVLAWCVNLKEGSVLYVSN